MEEIPIPDDATILKQLVLTADENNVYYMNMPILNNRLWGSLKTTAYLLHTPKDIARYQVIAYTAIMGDEGNFDVHLIRMFRQKCQAYAWLLKPT